jgi:hypothetical protein
MIWEHGAFTTESLRTLERQFIKLQTLGSRRTFMNNPG